jgi:hypothetical protein
VKSSIPRRSAAGIFYSRHINTGNKTIALAVLMLLIADYGTLGPLNNYRSDRAVNTILSFVDSIPSEKRKTRYGRRKISGYRKDV